MTMMEETSPTMEIYSGIAASQGIGIGPAHLLANNVFEIAPEKAEDVTKELQKFNNAMDATREMLRSLHEKTLSEVGEQEAQIFEIHLLMMEDLDYLESIDRFIKEEGYVAEYAVYQTGEEFAAAFAAMDDEYMKARSDDVKDISRHIVQHILMPLDESDGSDCAPHIVFADDLLPSETIKMDKSKVIAFVTKTGSWTSHAAILARTLGIPAVLNLGDSADSVRSGDTVIVDGFEGKIYVNPDDKTLIKFRCKQAAHRERMQRLAALKDRVGQTKDGTRVEICANIGGKNDVVVAIENGAEGIGLFRSEFLFMQGNDYPSEETQAEAYRYVLAKMGGRRVVVRTFDVGADKTAPYMDFPHEDNPAMGCRATRYSLRHLTLMKTQLRALLRASPYGRLAIMFPMIATLEELHQAKRVFEACKKELDAEGVSYSPNIELGIMIEIPSAALISDALAAEVDFFSIGTNDLTQFTMAVDRMNGAIVELYDTIHPAVLRLMEMTAANAKKHGIWCGICGESGSDLRMTETWARMGITELSVSPGSILEVKEKLLSLDLKQPFVPYREYR